MVTRRVRYGDEASTIWFSQLPMTSSAEIPALSNHPGHQFIYLFVVTVAHFISEVESC